MLPGFRPRLSFANVTAMTGLVVALAGGTWAIGAIPDSQGRINACYQPTNVYNTVRVGDRRVRRVVKRAGQMRLLVTGTRCARGERKLVWNQQGPQGLQGVQGAQGIPGAQGQAGQNGANGATNVVRRFGTEVTIAPDTRQTVTATCDPGERATGGGTNPGGTVDDIKVIWDRPSNDPPNQWRAEIDNLDANGDNMGTITGQVIVVCASP